MHTKVNILILFTVNEGIAHSQVVSWRFGVVEIALKFLVSLCFHKDVTFSEKKKKEKNLYLTDLFQSLISKKKKQFGKLELKLIPSF